MTPISLSSGDLIADRRAQYAEMLFDGGDPTAAADLMREAVALAPQWIAGWFRLGEFCEASGDLQRAAEAWTEVLRLDPLDRLGASLKLSLIGAAHGIDAPPSAFVEALFDQYADRFDVSLVEKLAYRVPELILQALASSGRSRHAYLIDLGCGTGLMGERLRGAASFVEGYDISGQMLKKAEAKGCYDRLYQQDLQTIVLPDAVADLVVAADVLLYLGALERIFAAVASALRPDGLFAFSVERHEGPEPMVLRPSRRYAHCEAHVRELLARSGFAVLSIETHVIRHDRGEPIEGLIVVAQREALRAEETIVPGTSAGQETQVVN